MSSTAATLQLAAILLGAPDEESLTTLDELALEHGWLRPAVDELRQIPLQRWQAEHTRLFINGYPKTPCGPFASIHRHGLMQGAVLDELTRFYADAGVEPDNQLPADYLGTILAFAALLLERGTSEAGAQLQQLRERHLISWLPQYCERLQQHPQLRLYRDLSIQLQQWIAA